MPTKTTTNRTTPPQEVTPSKARSGAQNATAERETAKKEKAGGRAPRSRQPVAEGDCFADRPKSRSARPPRAARWRTRPSSRTPDLAGSSSRSRRSRRPCRSPTPVAPAPRAGAPSSRAGSPSPSEELKNEKVIHLKPPFIVKDLAAALGLKPFQVHRRPDGDEHFRQLNQTIEPTSRPRFASKHGFVFEREKREKGGGVHKPRRRNRRAAAGAAAADQGRDSSCARRS